MTPSPTAVPSLLEGSVEAVQGDWAGRIAPEGRYKGNPIRTARKNYTCDEADGWGETFRRCRKPIEAGERYVEGDVDPCRAGGFGHDRVCLSCAARVSK